MGEDAVIAEVHRPGVLTLREHREHDIRSPHRLRDARDGRHPPGDGRLDGGLAEVEATHLVAGGDEVARHRASHVSQPDPSDNRHGVRSFA